ncbi:CBN-PRX-11 protein [Caenorhabditis brenneri]|uniref:CBN-PRX-11 protein n=1 Tax=Caenorhabditis brenneri TaxID=135651 RepID=G0MIP3_CAEBE|nr:CBN-PRX-11 protein [Caenorhabditis brenneri]
MVNATTLAHLNTNVDHLSTVLSSYAGRDKAIRSLAFYLQLRSTTSPGASKEILALAKQLSAARLVSRQFNHPGMIKSCRQILQAFNSGRIGDPLEFFTGAAVTGIYTVYGVVELLAWLSDAKILAFDAAKLYKWCLYLWLSALINGILRQIRIIYRKGIEKSSEDILQLVALSSDFISGVNSLPHKFLWAGKLSMRQSATFSLLASIIGFYKLW